MSICIEEARFPADADAIHILFRDYAASLRIDLSFQNFQHELDSLPGRYSGSQGGALLIAHSSPRAYSDLSSVLNSSTERPSALGCVALRQNYDGWAEMKRLYVIDRARGERLGARLVESILAQARALGYRGVRLDTLSHMTAAQALYRKYGFIEIAPYYDSPIEGTVFMSVEFSNGRIEK
ncbi:hypothetical protein N7492_006807 [Penicillium capsulatum]|uniref:N-acetyltransferase domain-containing protein n=1 Tax=Penicillium capsulatum TaxID=69766 RepID=A0A9W9I249_9EURO|nr:hypothetical protein N7492_006807 [Penicillium capsulatum]KAJ6116642.1 hypothetical protein N7512_006367 [Penicillium capsulatum]